MDRTTKGAAKRKAMMIDRILWTILLEAPLALEQEEMHELVRLVRKILTAMPA